MWLYCCVWRSILFGMVKSSVRHHSLNIILPLSHWSRAFVCVVASAVNLLSFIHLSHFQLNSLCVSIQMSVCIHFCGAVSLQILTKPKMMKQMRTVTAATNSNYKWIIFNFYISFYLFVCMYFPYLFRLQNTDFAIILGYVNVNSSLHLYFFFLFFFISIVLSFYPFKGSFFCV